MGRACCILGCPSGGDAPSHHIPKNPALFQKWKSVIYSEKIKNMTDEQISKCAVCYRHFADEDYLVTFRVRKLKRGIVPSLNLPNRPATDNDEPNAGTTETSDSSSSTCIERKTTESCTTEIESETVDVALFEDLPDEAEFCFKQLQLNNENNENERVEETNSTEDSFQLYCQKRILRRKRAKLTEQQLAFLRYKKQSEQYEKTPTIQKLLSFLTRNEIASLKTKIRKSKYSPKIYVKEYHEIAKQRALGQL